MSDEYTPTTDQVRNNMAFGVAMAHFAPEEASNVEYPIPGWRGRAKSEFDLWLAAHDAEVKADAWCEGYTHGYNEARDYHGFGAGGCGPDPYDCTCTIPYGKAAPNE